MAAVIFIGVVVVVVGRAIYQALFFPDQLLYTVQDDGPSGAVNAIAVMDADGSVEIAHDKDGLYLPRNPSSRQYHYLAPKGEWLAYYERSGSAWEIVLTAIDGTPIYSDKMAIQGAAVTTQGFSPNGRLYAYTTYEDEGEDVTLHVIDNRGVEILTVPDAAFADFFPNNSRLLVYQVDRDGLFEGLAWVSLNDGVMNIVTDLSDSSGWIRPLVSPDGRQVYYYEDEELLVTSVDGGPAKEIYEFDSQSSSVFYSPDQKYLAIYDQISGQNLGELYLVKLDDEKKIKIDEDVNSRAVQPRQGEAAVIFSPKGDKIAYLTDQGDEVTLYVVRTDGTERNRISNNNVWVSFAFSPNGKNIAYIEGDGSNEPGDLYIAKVDGSEKLKLDVDIWSFEFAPNGRIVYSKVDDIDKGDPESEIYEVRANGKNTELLLDTQEGVITLLDWAGR